MQLRSLIGKVQGTEKDPSNLVEVPKTPCEIVVDSLDLSHALDSVHVSSASSTTADELESYLSQPVTPSMRQDLNKSMGVVQFCHRNAGMFPSLTRVAYRLLATQPSSAASERDFSAIAHIIKLLRNWSTSRLVSELIQLRTDHVRT